jgi:hypothetical protein
MREGYGWGSKQGRLMQEEVGHSSEKSRGKHWSYQHQKPKARMVTQLYKKWFCPKRDPLNQ